MEVCFGRRKSDPSEEGRIDFQYFTSVHTHQTTFYLSSSYLGIDALIQYVN